LSFVLVLWSSFERRFKKERQAAMSLDSLDALERMAVLMASHERLRRKNENLRDDNTRLRAQVKDHEAMLRRSENQGTGGSWRTKAAMMPVDYFVVWNPETCVAEVKYYIANRGMGWPEGPYVVGPMREQLNADEIKVRLQMYHDHLRESNRVGKGKKL
jgi:hypothetical protein